MDGERDERRAVRRCDEDTGVCLLDYGKERKEGR